ncbi:hypothetical protein P7K49_027004 [Saguinus oedipus]|uniref:Uncharacterized protein n=1 Tax=Saguinus oedipus TaxID=9490 RepID=A0ABQ9UGA4_SAGOE|nr:hypothetical protein P7K49_027004 [Saguinus oedipus]
MLRRGRNFLLREAPLPPEEPGVITTGAELAGRPLTQGETPVFLAPPLYTLRVRRALWVFRGRGGARCAVSAWGGGRIWVTRACRVTRSCPGVTRNSPDVGVVIRPRDLT